MKKSLLTIALLLGFASADAQTLRRSVVDNFGQADSLSVIMTRGGLGPEGYVVGRVNDTIGWVNPSAGSGTVSSVGMTVPTGLSVSGSPITTSGTLSLTYAAGYVGYTTTEASKLSGIAAGAQVNVPTNLAQGTRTATTVPITSSTGTSATLAAATTSLAGVMSSADKTKLDGIAAGATANTGTVTSVSGTGTVSGLTLTGSVTGAGSLTLGGSISGLNTSVLTAGTLPVARGGTGITSFASGMATWLGSATSANLRGTLTDETGTGVAVFNIGPSFERMVTGDSATFDWISVGQLVGGIEVDSVILDGITPGNMLTTNADGKIVDNNTVKVGASQLAFFNGTLRSKITLDCPTVLADFNPVTNTEDVRACLYDLVQNVLRSGGYNLVN